MKYDFDVVHDRRASGSLKWNFAEAVLKEPGVIPMWIADMDFEAPPEVIEAVVKRAEHGIYGYPMVPDSFWESAVRWLKTRHDWQTKREWMTIAPGVVPAIHLGVRALTEPGDEIIIQTPVYRPFFDAIEKNGRLTAMNPLKYDGKTWRMDLKGLGKKIRRRTKLLILCSPHNPVGRVWTREELEELDEVCAEHDLTVISDEIHEDFVFGNRHHVPFASLSEDAARRTLTCIAPNKTFNLAGLTTAIAISSYPRHIERFKAEAEATGIGVTNIFGITALEAAFNHGAEWLDSLLPYIIGNMETARDFLAERAPKVRFLMPEGTYVALLDCRELGLPQEELDDFFLHKAKVYLETGVTYGEELEGFERINLACPRPILMEALERIANAVK